MKDNIRHSMWGICLDIDFKCDFVIVNKASLWISHILKHNISQSYLFITTQHETLKLNTND